MSNQSDVHTDVLEYVADAFLGSMDQLITVDALSFEQLGEHFNYSGNTMKGIIRQRAHQPDWRRVLLGLKSLSKNKNLRLHKHVLDGVIWEVVPRYKQPEPKGDLKDEYRKAVRAMVKAEEGLTAGSTKVLNQAKRILLEVISQIEAEERAISVELKKMED